LVPHVGVALVSIDYRLIGSAPDGGYTNTFPTASYDMDRAVRFVRANAARWDLDPSRIIVAGASAGGQLAALAGVAPGTYTDPTLPPDLARVSPRHRLRRTLGLPHLPAGRRMGACPDRRAARLRAAASRDLRSGPSRGRERRHPPEPSRAARLPRVRRTGLARGSPDSGIAARDCVGAAARRLQPTRRVAARRLVRAADQRRPQLRPPQFQLHGDGTLGEVGRRRDVEVEARRR
jgi:acetyl esterase/lipase